VLKKLDFGSGSYIPGKLLPLKHQKLIVIVITEVTL